jgi:hypothetical protein
MNESRITKQEAELKSALVKRLNVEYPEVGRRLVCRAVQEADALASSTLFPLLVLPALAEEKVQSVAVCAFRQEFTQDPFRHERGDAPLLGRRHMAAFELTPDLGGRWNFSAAENPALISVKH